MYQSFDSGATWAIIQNLPAGNWEDIAMSSDGSKIAICNFGEYIYTSADYGVTWTPRTLLGERNWYNVKCSADGSKLAAVDQGGKLYTFSN